MSNYHVIMLMYYMKKIDIDEKIKTYVNYRPRKQCI